MSERRPRPKIRVPRGLEQEIRDYFEDLARTAAVEAIREELARAELHRTVVDLSTEWRVAAETAAKKIDAGPKRRTGKAPTQ